MKKLLLAGILAVTLVAMSQPRAAAWFRLKSGGCLRFSLEGSLPCLYFGYSPGAPPHDHCHSGDWGAYPVYGYGSYSGYGSSSGYGASYGYGSVPPAASAPSFTPPAPRPLEQPSGYYSPSPWSPYYGSYYVDWYR